MKFWDPSIFRERFELETSNLTRRLIAGGTIYNNEKLGQRGSGRGHVSRDLLLKFWDPSIFRERFELETSNLARRLIAGGTNYNNEKIGSKGDGKGHVTYFFEILGPLHISGTV